MSGTMKARTIVPVGSAAVFAFCVVCYFRREEIKLEELRKRASDSPGDQKMSWMRR